MELQTQIDEVLAGSRGFISIPGFRKETGCQMTTAGFRKAVEGKPLTIEKHGKYGYCIFRTN